MKMSELREKDTDSLRALEKELTENVFAAKLQKRTGQLENTSKIENAKRSLARVKTVLRARELGLELIVTAGTDVSKGTAPTAKPKVLPGAVPAGADAAPAKAAKTKGTAKGKAAAPAPAKKRTAAAAKSESKATKTKTKASAQKK